MYSVGYDIGSSSIKAALVDHNGKTIGKESYPKKEMQMIAIQEGWAEQDPNEWWIALCKATKALLKKTGIDRSEVESIGISYQMHGLVLVDKDQEVLRPSIIWCDSRAVEIGQKAFEVLGAQYCYGSLLNSPGNFTASKLKWVQDNEPKIYEQIDKIMLPGDFIAMKMTGVIASTISGLSEGIFWNYKENGIAYELLDYYGIDSNLLPEIVDTFSNQGSLSISASSELGLPQGIPIGYRAGDQPNNALSLGVLNPGDIAATGGTSGVVYGISDDVRYDEHSRVNGFAHVNHSEKQIRIGQLLCINGAGSQYAWIRNQMATANISYTDMEECNANIPIGSDGLRIIPFGNGAERILKNKHTGAQFNNIQFNIHGREHFYRAALEGIAFAFIYGIRILETIGISPKLIKVGNDNLFQSSVLSSTIANIIGCRIEMMDTTGAIGAAKASAVAIGVYNSQEEAVSHQMPIKTYLPDSSDNSYIEAYESWKNDLLKLISTN